MLILLGVSWTVVNSNPFSVSTLVTPGALMPVVVLFFCFVAWAAFASTRLCQHTACTTAIVVWTVNIYLVVHLVVYGFAPAFGIAALFVMPMRKISCPITYHAHALIIGSAVTLTAACILLADPRHLLSPGGYRTFDEATGSEVERSLVFLAAPIFATSAYLFPPRSNPVQTIACSGTVVLGLTTILGFMGSMTVLDNSGSLSGLDFYHCGFVFVWSTLLFVVMLLLCAFHVIGLAMDAFVTLGITTVTVSLMQWIVKHEGPHPPQLAGLLLMGITVALFHWMQTIDNTAPQLDGNPFFTCQACEQEEECRVEEALSTPESPL